MSKRLAMVLCIILIHTQPSCIYGQTSKSKAETQNSLGEGAAAALSIAERADREIFFEAHIRPILVEKCVKCHNDQKTSGGLKLLSHQNLLKGGDNGPAIVPGDSNKSLISIAIGRKSEDIAPMPPKESLSKTQIQDLNRWINDGAIWPESVTKLISNTTQTKSDETHWSFRPVQNPSIPKDSTNWSRSEIDRFVNSRWNGLQPSPDADLNTLVRRLYYDLIGLPPDKKIVDQLNSSTKSQWNIETLVDNLLDSPRFGERWARHWMDVVRYADTAGDNADYPVPEARLYRDYLIDAFNKDMPFDQMVREQIAGDLLARDLIKNQKPLSSQSLNRYKDLNTATTFIGLSRRYATAPFELMHLTIEDTISTTGLAFLGLNFRCARCHDHKYDPITARDYYALYGVFSSTTYPFAGSEEFQSKKLPRSGFVPLVPPDQTATLVTKNKLKNQELKSQTIDLVGPITPEMQKQQASIRAWVERSRRLGDLPEDLETAYGASESKPHNVPLQRKGEPDQPGELIPRSVPQFIAGTHPPEMTSNESGRRELAQWLTDPENPLTARVYVNRVWQSLFGRGLVETPNDFGTRGAVPTHPELLDYLASRFMENGWSTKKLIREIIVSRVYQLSSTDTQNQSQIDPENRLLWRHSRRRMDAESIRDSLLAISGELQFERPGAHPFPSIENWRWSQHDPFKAVYETKHRTVYLMTQRIQKHPFLALFDGPDTNTSTGKRSDSSVPLQSLHLANHPFFVEQSNAIADRVMANPQNGKDHFDDTIRSIWTMTIGRNPDTQEMQLARDLLNSGQDLDDEHRKSVMRSFVHSLLMSNTFLYID